MELIVTPDGRLRAGPRQWRCTLGRAGVTTDKHEGDGASPAGTYWLRRLFYRPDRVAPPETRLWGRTITPDDAWCDDPTDPRYNMLVRLPYPAHVEKLWRQDGIYDLVIVIGYNDQPAVPGRGSAIFLHIANPDWAPTAGCVGLARDALLALLPELGPESTITIEPPAAARD